MNKEKEIKNHNFKRKPEKLESLDKKKMMIQIKEELNKEESRKISIKEGAFASISQGVGGSYISPFAIALGANNASIGILASIPSIIGPLAQLKGSRFMEKISRKKIIVKYVFLQALMWLSLLVIALLAYLGVVDYLPLILIIFYSILVFVGGLAFPGWFSWMGDIVPEEIRGKYFAKRNKIAGTVLLISMLIASFLLDFLRTKGLVLIAFAILFFIAFLARALSAYMFTKTYETKLKLEKGYYVPLSRFIRGLFKHNFGWFIVFITSFSFVKFIASPFFAVYMLRDLGLSYIWFSVITLSTTIFTLISLPLWGKISDKYGNRNLIKISLALTPLAPILWLFSTNPLYLTFVPGIIAGLGWGAFNLGTSNFIYDSVSPQRRGLYSAYYNFFVGIGIILGGLFGGMLAQFLTISFMNKLLFLFLLSGILRFVIGFTLFSKVKEVRKVRKTKQLTTAIMHEIKPIYFHGHQGIFHEPLWFKYLAPSRTKKY